MRRALRLVAPALALGLAVLLAGCLVIPQSGTVTSVEIQPDDEPDDLLLVPDGPVAGATPEEIVEGFLLAGQGPQNSYSVAREFLADGFRSEWSPNGGVLVTSSSLTASALANEGRVEVPVQVEASVDADGRYADEADSELRSLRFSLAQQSDGEWRITDAPAGIVLPPTAFELIFEPYALYFFDPAFDYLVPELRWFLPSTASSRIVQELVAGQSTLLSEGVLVSGFPSGAQTDGTVAIESGRATVPLDASVAAQSVGSQRRMLQQLEASLVALPDVREVTITVGGFPLDITNSAITPDRTLAASSSSLGVIDGEFGVITGSGIVRVEGIGRAIDGLAATAVTVSRTSDSAAVLGSAGVSYVADGEATLLDPRSGLVAPSLDPWDWTWSAPATDPARIAALSPTGQSQQLSLGVSGRLDVLRVSRDGTRLAAVVQQADGPHLIVAGIARNRDLAPTGIVPLDDVALAADRVLDLVWADGVTLAVVRRTGSAERVDSITIGGQTADIGGVEGAVQIAAGTGIDTVRVRTADGSVLRLTSEVGWTSTGSDASLLAVLG